VVPTPNLPQF